MRLPDGNYEGYVEAHVRRLEALRRAGIIERLEPAIGASPRTSRTWRGTTAADAPDSLASACYRSSTWTPR